MASGMDLSGMSGSPSFQGGSASAGSDGTFGASEFNSSGWTIATGGSKATGGASNPWLLGGLAVAILAGAWLISRKK